VRCEKRYGERAERGAKRAASSSSPTSAPAPLLTEDDVAALFAPSESSALSASESSNAAAPSPAPSETSSPTWCGHAGKMGAMAFVSVLEALYERAGREANEVEPHDLQEFQEDLGRALAAWFPNAELTPFKKCLITGAGVAGSMWIGAKKLPPKDGAPAKATVVAPASSAAATPTATTSTTAAPAEIKVPKGIFADA